MKNHKLLFFLLTLTFLLHGCNSIYLYETEKYSLTIEGRPDASSPVSFNLGVKQRVASVIPSKGKDNDIQCNGRKSPVNIESGKSTNAGEAYSLISYFDLNKKDKPGWFNDPITVETALMTGKIAACADSNTPALMNAMVSKGALQNPGAHYSTMRHILNSLDKNDMEDKKYLDSLDSLSRTVIPAKYPVNVFNIVDETILVDKQKDSPINNNATVDISDALTYWGKIDNSSKRLEGVLKTPDQFKYQGVPANNEIVISGLQSEFEKTKQELDRVGSELATNPVYTGAIQFYIDKYLKQANSGK